MSNELPIYHLIPQLKHQLEYHHEAILEAAPVPVKPQWFHWL
ncbi:hypothetical protein [Marinomonas rhodophyticola]|uniref:Uncharacterized protein n=1 Tax=Marinomonas rhodophyticola TaxID=2992803 RepID=A0ABT3KFN3_9GAMM|nr:hypothetical protein [Marinomonas sp. KJ51-3]MCW4628981.1 hypothetical protein [Marinomonas sp. KJ51-3]